MEYSLVQTDDDCLKVKAEDAIMLWQNPFFSLSSRFYSRMIANTSAVCVCQPFSYFNSVMSKCVQITISCNRISWFTGQGGNKSIWLFKAPSPTY